MTILILRRYLGFFGKAELGKKKRQKISLSIYLILFLGGPTIPKYMCSIFFILLWISYLTLSGLQAYGHIKWQS